MFPKKTICLIWLLSQIINRNCKYLKVSVEYFVQMQILETNQDFHKIEFRFIFSEFAIL